MMLMAIIASMLIVFLVRGESAYAGIAIVFLVITVMGFITKNNKKGR